MFTRSADLYRRIVIDRDGGGRSNDSHSGDGDDDADDDDDAEEKGDEEDDDDDDDDGDDDDDHHHHDDSDDNGLEPIGISMCGAGLMPPAAYHPMRMFLANLVDGYGASLQPVLLLGLHRGHMQLRKSSHVPLRFSCVGHPVCFPQGCGCTMRRGSASAA